MRDNIQKIAAAIYCFRFAKPEKYIVTASHLKARYYYLLIAAAVSVVLALFLARLSNRSEIVGSSGLSELPLAFVSGSLGVFLYSGGKAAHVLGTLKEGSQVDGFLTSPWAMVIILLRLFILLLILTGSSYLLAWFSNIPLESYFNIFGEGLTVDIEEWMSTAVVLLGFITGLSAHVLYPPCWVIDKQNIKEAHQ